MDRLGRNLDDLRKLVKGLTSKGVGIRFIKEWLATFASGVHPSEKRQHYVNKGM